jgi:hypothetical protein
MLKSYPYGDKSSNLQTPFVPSSLQNILRSCKGSKDMYTILNKNSNFPTAQRRTIIIDKIVNKLYTPVEPLWIKDSSFVNFYLFI